MSKHKFSVAERFGLLEAHSRRCPYCREMILGSDVTVDHIIPEHILNKPSELAKVKLQYGLPEDFCLNSFENWVPAHRNCNERKGPDVFPAGPEAMSLLALASRKGKTARMRARQLDKEYGRDKVKQKMVEEVELGHLNTGDLEESALVARTLEYADRLNVVGGWQVVSVENDTLAVVTRNGHVGMTPLDGDYHNSWVCYRCISPGPWNGNRCLSCGAWGELD